MTAGKLILLGLFGALVAVIGLVVARAERSMGLSQVLLRPQDTTAQIRVRGAFVLLIGFVALAEQVALETILGALAAGALLGLIDRDQVMTHPQFRLKLEAAGFGLFSPIFFVTSGLRFDLNALFSSSDSNKTAGEPDTAPLQATNYTQSRTYTSSRGARCPTDHCGKRSTIGEPNCHTPICWRQTVSAKPHSASIATG